MASMSSAALPESPESPGSAGPAPTSKRARLYALEGGALMLVSELEERSPAPHGDGVELLTEGSAIAAAARAGDSLLLVVLQEESVIHAWHLSFAEEREEGLQEKEEVEPDEKADTVQDKDDTDEEGGEGLQEKEVVEPDEKADTDEKTDDTDEEGEESLQKEEEEPDEKSDTDEDGHEGQDTDEAGSDTENSDDLEQHLYSLKLRIWHRSLRLHLLLFDKKKWLLTRQYSICCLSNDEMELLKETTKEQFLKDQPYYTLVLRSDYEGMMVPSANVALFVESNLLPTLYDFQKHQLLGKGGYSNVILGNYRYDHKDYAIKIMKLETYIHDEPREVTIQSFLSSSPYSFRFSQAWIGSFCDFKFEEPSISGSNSTGSDEDYVQDGCLCISMDYCKRTLKEYLSFESHECNVERSNVIFEELIKGLKYMEDSGIVHRDLKPSNIFFGDDGRVKIADFGHSRFCPVDSISFEGTPNRGSLFYRAPELKSGCNTSVKSDIYSAGVMYLLLFNSFKTMAGMVETFSAYRKDATDSKVKWEIGNIELFRKMTAENPIDRPSASCILQDYISK